MDATTHAASLDRLLTALEFGTAKEDRELTDRLLGAFSLPRTDRSRLIDGILTGPGFEPFFVALVQEARPFALMLKQVYRLLSQFGTTAERRATLFRVSGAGARTAFDFDLDAFPREVLRWIGEIEAAVDILQLQFGSEAEARGKFLWRSSRTRQLWDAVDPIWDGDFYDNGFHVALSYAEIVLADAGPEQKARAEALVTPIFDRLRALTAVLQWPELGVTQGRLEGVSQSFMSGKPEQLDIHVYPAVRSRLDRDAAIAYFRTELAEDAGGSAPFLGGPVQESLWEKVSRSLLAFCISIDLWHRRARRRDPRRWMAERTGQELDQITPAQYLDVLQPLAEQYRANLDALLRVVDQQSVSELREALVEFFGLPFWTDRWFLYELWTLCHVLTIAGSRWPTSLLGLEDRNGVIEWKLPGGLASAPVACVGANKEIECWIQRKTLHPESGEGLEPDLRITRSGTDHPDLFIVENKDRRKPRTAEMKEILERYVSGTQAQCVCLVNYDRFTGPTHNLVPADLERPVLILSHFQPGRESAEFRARLLKVLEEELRAPAATQIRRPTSASRSDSIEIALARHPMKGVITRADETRDGELGIDLARNVGSDEPADVGDSITLSTYWGRVKATVLEIADPPLEGMRLPLDLGNRLSELQGPPDEKPEYRKLAVKFRLRNLDYGPFDRNRVTVPEMAEYVVGSDGRRISGMPIGPYRQYGCPELPEPGQPSSTGWVGFHLHPDAEPQAFILDGLGPQSGLWRLARLR